MPNKPKVAMVGRGHVGRALAEGLRRAGYPVQTAGREPEKVRSIVRNADVVVLAVPFGERDNALREMDDAVGGKVLVDATNALSPSMQWAGDLNRSGAEEIQQKARGAKVVKAFNTAFAQNMDKGRVRNEPISLFVAGDDAEAKRRVLEMGSDLGFDPVDSGPLVNARWIEAMGYFHIVLGYQAKLGTDTEFRLLRGRGG
jgi:predicted dinucleotide-binding enzyme